jgi:putative ABC transport system ATP-binding protein
MTRIDIDHASVVYHRGSNAIRALDDVSLRVDEGEYVTVIGPNGAGKSTLVHLIAGAVKPTSGRVLFGGTDVTSVSDTRRARWVGRVFQDPSQGTCEGLTVIENLALGLRRGSRRSPFARAVNHEDTAHAQQLIDEYGSDLGERLRQDISKLSGGQRQLISMLMAVASHPSILLLDEHTSALDPAIGLALMNNTDAIVREQRMTTIMITHNMRLAAAYGDRVLIMNGGRIVDDIAGGARRDLTEDDLIERFRHVAADTVTDRMLG